MIKRVEHVGIMTTDMDESIKFYQTFLNFELRLRVNNGEKELAFLLHDGLPGFEIELIQDKQPTTTYAEQGLVNHLAFVVENFEETMAKLKKQGIIFLTDEPKKGINDRKTIRFKGPSGETLQLVEERIS